MGVNSDNSNRKSASLKFPLNLQVDLPEVPRSYFGLRWSRSTKLKQVKRGGMYKQETLKIFEEKTSGVPGRCSRRRSASN